MDHSHFIGCCKSNGNGYWRRCRANVVFCLFLVLIADIEIVHCKTAVVVKEADYEGLKAIKREFVDLKGVLRSWNESEGGACSGEWTGIKCENGQVISIQLPWKGLGGRISEKIGQLQALRRLSLHDNILVGPVPASLGFLPKLRGIYLFNNRLSGSIPPSIGNCLFLQNLDLSINQLTGIIPPTLANSTRLYRLNLSFNSLSGYIPPTLSQNPSITFLALEYNNLSGSVPEYYNNNNHSYKLQSLSLHHNLLTGEIPISIINLSNLESFDVSYNNLSGTVPSVLAKKFNSSSFIGNIQLCGYSNSTPCPPSPQLEIKTKNHRRLSTKDIILIAAGALLVLLLTLCSILLCCLIRKRAASKNSGGRGAKSIPPASATAGVVESGGGGKLVHFDGPFVFTADDLLCATAEIMGKSTYGTSYKATLEDDNEVAVKRLREKITKPQKEFEIEVAELGKIRHPNILGLRAYYLGPKGEKLLVYDYMPNGSLASFLHARGPETSILWPTRMAIAIGITRGLCSLHAHNDLIHGNLTSSVILLDENYNPTIGDVGLSGLMTNAANNTNTSVATAGAMGYRAPELSKIKIASATTKSDVFSLGVIILELLTGKSPSEATDGLDLPQWVASIVKEEWTNEVFDVELIKDSSDIGDQLLNTLKLALHCVDPSPAARPETHEILQKLEEIKPDKKKTTLFAPPASISGDDDGILVPPQV